VITKLIHKDVFVKRAENVVNTNLQSNLLKIYCLQHTKVSLLFQICCFHIIAFDSFFYLGGFFFSVWQNVLNSYIETIFNVYEVYEWSINIASKNIEIQPCQNQCNQAIQDKAWHHQNTCTSVISQISKRTVIIYAIIAINFKYVIEPK